MSTRGDAPAFRDPTEPDFTPPAGLALRRALRLRCPICGRGKPFTGLLGMRADCGHCGYIYEREPGYFVGALYFNYLPFALLMIVAFFTVAGIWNVGLTRQWPWLAALGVLGPLLFFRHSRMLWIAFDLRLTAVGPRDFQDGQPRTLSADCLDDGET